MTNFLWRWNKLLLYMFFYCFSALVSLSGYRKFLNLSGIECCTGSLIASQKQDIFPCLVFREGKGVGIGPCLSQTEKSHQKLFML